jgi:YEATS family
MITEAQHQILFWVFLGFFLVIGLVAVLAILGVIKTEKQFRKWAVGGFVVGVTGAVFVWARAPLPIDFFVNLPPPKGVDVDTFELVSGSYEYYGQSGSDKSTSPSGPVELTAGQLLGSWTAKFPYKGVDKAVKLTLKDSKGNSWGVRPFYPNFNNQSLIPTGPQETAATPAPPSIIANAFAAGKEIRFNNYAKKIRALSERTYYRWRVFVDEPDQVLKGIAEVQYLLHPTFPEPLQVRTNPADKFAVEASGWGQFLIHIAVKYKDGSTVETGYNLDLTKGWP